jgi:hypothetical protein
VGSEKLETRNDDVQPLWKPAHPQSVRRHLILPHSFFLFAPRAMWEISQGFTFAVVWLRTGAGPLEQLELWNAWNLR